MTLRKEVKFTDNREKVMKERNKTRKNSYLIDFEQAGNNQICQVYGKRLRTEDNEEENNNKYNEWYY